MRFIRTPVILFVLLYAGLLVYVNQTTSMLPDRVATHFGIDGQPNGWMTRSGYIAFISAFGLGLPAFTIIAAFLSRFLPSWMINIPNRDYWLAPERRPYTDAYVLRFCLWLACLEVGLVGGMHYLTVVANRTVPVRMPTGALVTVLAIFVAVLGVWSLALVRRFRNV